MLLWTDIFIIEMIDEDFRYRRDYVEGISKISLMQIERIRESEKVDRQMRERGSESGECVREREREEVGSKLNSVRQRNIEMEQKRER